MTVVVTHTTPADSTFSSTGAAAWNADHALSGVGTMAEQNANAVAITGGTINNTTIGATTPSTGVFTTVTTPIVGAATGSSTTGLDLNVNSKAQARIVEIGDGTRPLVINGGSAGGAQIPGISVPAVLGISAGGGNPVNFYTNGRVTTQQFAVSHTASAVNYVQVTGAATGLPPTISAQGSDSAPNLAFQVKSGAAFNFYSQGGLSARQFRIEGGANAVNALQVAGSVAGIAPTLSVLGTDTNIPVAIQSKGTGAIDLAAGSSGVNISNGGTVTAITRTASGSGYTSLPSIAISAPTTAGGVQATATCTLGISSASSISGGTGYTLNDVVTVVGGTNSSAAVATVSGVSGGVVTALTFTSFGAYTVLPTNPVSVTGGTGSGLTFNAGGIFVNSGFTITNAGSGYVEQPTVTFSGGGGSGAAAYATVGSIPTVKSIGSAISFSTAGGEQVRIVDSNSAATNYVALGGGTGAVSIFAEGSATNISETFSSKGTGSLTFQTNRFAQTQLLVTHTASAVNYVQVTGATTTSSPIISAQGSDTNAGLIITSKGTSGLLFRTQNNTYTQFRIGDTSGVNYLQVAGAATGFGPVLSAQGSDTNIPAVVQPKGTGALQAQQTDSTATGGNARGANAVDWQTSRSTAAMVASGQYATVSGGYRNTASGFSSTVSGGETNSNSGYIATISGGATNTSSGSYTAIAGGYLNTNSKDWSFLGAGYGNTAGGFHNFIGSGYSNSGTSASAVTTQSATMNGTTAVTLSGSNASIKVGQLITGTSIANFPNTYVAAISGTSLTLSQAASGSSTSTLSFFTPHGVVVGGGNNQATGSYSFIGGGGDAGTAANRNVASGAWSVVVGGIKNTASGSASFVGGGGFDGSGTVLPNTASGVLSFVGGGWNNTANASWATIVGGQSHIANNLFATVCGGSNNNASGYLSVISGGSYGSTRSITGYQAFPAHNAPISAANYGISQGGLLIIGKQTTDATATVLVSDTGGAGTTNQVILPNNSAYAFRGTVIANVTGGGNTKAWAIEGAIKRGANAASTALVGTPTVTSAYADVGAATWAITATADTTNGGLAITFTGQAGTTIRVVAKLETTEVTF